MGRGWLLVIALTQSCGLFAATYHGPRPPKSDIPYLLHAGNLVETEEGDAGDSDKKNEVTYTIAGANSPVKTPLAEPIFLVDAKTANPERFEMYRVESRNGHREVSMSAKRRRGSQPVHLAVRSLAEHLYRVEADEPLENGEYCISPSDSNRVFCFAIY